MSAEEDFAQALTTTLAREISGFKTLKNCRQLTAGASQETYQITYEGSEGEIKLALRRAQPTADSETSIGGIGLEAEARLFKVAKKYNIPSPEVIYELKSEDNLGSGFIMNWLEGETMGHRINRRPELNAVRPQLAQLCGNILGRIHSIDWQEEKLDDFLEEIDTRTQIQMTWDQYRELNVPIPMIDFTARWLLENLPEQARTTLVHKDFRNGNLMVNANGVEAVLDWELAHIGDPIQDLGWLCVNSWRFGNSHLPVGGFGEIEDLLSGYQEATGLDVDQQELKFWQVFGSFWWAVCTLTMAQSWRTGETPSLERPVIGRRSSEAQMDCVNLLIPGDIALPNVKTDFAEGTHLPMPAELLIGVEEFLKNTVAEKMDSHNQFLAKVAANSLSIAKREFQYGEELKAQESERLTNLLGSDADLDGKRWLLVDKLRGELSLDTPGLQQHLRLTVAGQLFIDQPQYSALKV